MPGQISTGFSVIDTYNIIREDLQTTGAEFEEEEEEEFSRLNDQQGVPQFAFTTPATCPSPPFPHHPHPHQQVRASFPSPAPSSPYPSHPSPSLSPAPQGADPGQQQQQSTLLLDMEVSASFLEELMGGRPTPTPVHPPLPAPHHTSSTYVAEAAGAGCTVVQTASSTSPPSAEEGRDQQLLDLDVADLYDLDRHSFYDDAAGAKVTLAEVKVDGSRRSPSLADWAMAELGEGREGEGRGRQLTELGPVAGSEQADLLTAFDSLRRDILLDCRQLGISANPRSWSAQDSGAWVLYMVDKVQRPDDCSASLALPGPLLCQKTEEELLWASPSSGDFLHQQLELWKALADLPTLSSKPQPAEPQPTLNSAVASHPHPPLPPPPPSAAADFHLSPHPGANNDLLLRSSPSVSPAPSMDSVGSSSQSSLSQSSSSPSSSDMGMMFFCGPDSSEEDLFYESDANLTPPYHHHPSPSSTTPTTTTTSSSSRPPKARGGRPGKQIRLWEFLKQLLEEHDPSMKWLDRSRGIFKIEDSNRVASLWGTRKNHPAMNYDKLSRSVRQYYKKGIIKKTTQTRRLVYQFCERYL